MTQITKKTKISVPESKPSQVINVAQIGCHGVAHNHAQAHSLTGNTRLVAVCDIEPTRAIKFAQQYDVENYYTDFSSLLTCPQIDAIDIVTPDDTHVELALAAIQANKHVLIEKPIACSNHGMQQIIRAAAKHNVTAMCAQSLRWLPKYRRFVEAIHSGAVGTPVYIRFWGGCSPFWSADNWPEKASQGNPAYLLKHNGMHWMDLITWMLDDYPETVYTIGHKGQSDVPLWEYFAVNMRFAEGAIALAEDNRIMQPSRYPMPGMGLYFVGTEGTLSLEASKDLSVSMYTEDGISFPGSHVYSAVIDDNFVGELRHFADCVLGNDTPEIPLKHSAKVLAAVLCAVESFESNTELKVHYE